MEQVLNFKIDMTQVSGMPEEAARLMLEMYEEVASICKKMNIELYFLKRNWGLAEGTGLALFRPEFDRLLTQLPKHIDANRYFLQHQESDVFWTGPQARLRLHGSLMEDPLHADLAVHQGIYINIYPIDAFPKQALAQQNLLNQYRKAQADFCHTDMTDQANSAKYLKRRNKLIRATKSKRNEWFIIYPMVAESVINCIINGNELILTGDAVIPTPGNYDDWLFDIAEDIQ